jgi:uracil-DNA glycosylase
MALKRLLREVRACRICEADLPFGPRPVLQLASTARLLIIGQAPGSKVHQTGIPWNDASGDRLRDWLKLDRSVFYDAAKVAILPVGPGPEKVEAISRLAPNVHRFGTRVCSSTFRISG